MNHATRALATIVFFITVLAASTALADTLTFSGANDISVEATDASGATVTFTITAIDASSTPFTVTCTPPSGNLFSIGTTTVSCEAVDGIGATSTASFAVGVFEIASSTATSTDATSSPQAATSTPLTIEGHVDVSATCQALDTDGVAHDYAAASSTSYLAICAVEAAKSAGIISGIGLSNQFPAFGLFVTQINDVAADPSSQYWALYQNGGFAALGITSLPVAAGDTIEMRLHDFSDNDLGSHLTIHIDSLIGTTTATTTSATSTPSTDTAPPPASSGSGGGGGISHTFLNVANALAYLSKQQSSDGSFNSDMLSDWAAIAFASADPDDAKAKLKTYLASASPTLSNVTDYERHAMALEALGIDPYVGATRDYIAPIVAAFDGTQIGDSALDNDDIFAIFPLLHAGYGTSDTVIQKTIQFIMSRQKADGSWDGSVDLTAAAIQALTMTSTLPNVSSALTKAENYLHSKQQTNGGWENSFSTSWAMQAIAALGQSASNWTPGSDTPEEYLASLQQSDGGVDSISASDSMRIWATAYAIPAAQNKIWDYLLASFKKPATTSNVASNATEFDSVATSTSTAASDADTATTTPLVLGASTTTIHAATSTPIVPPPAPKPQPRPLPKKLSSPPTIENVTVPASETTSILSPQSQAAAVGATHEKPNFFVRIWNFLVNLFTW